MEQVVTASFSGAFSLAYTKPLCDLRSYVT